MPLTFTGTVEDDLNTVRELITGMPASAQHRARAIAEKIRIIVEQVQKDNPKDPAAGVGLLFALLFTYDAMIQDNRSLIQLLS